MIEIQNDLFPEEIRKSWNISVERVISAYRFSQNLGMGKLYVAFSGGKDSVAVYGICKLAAGRLGMDVLDMCDFYYHITNVDPPELVMFIKREFPFVVRDLPKKTMWQLIIQKKIAPTRIVRYCCSELKERGGKGRFCVTGVRWAESTRRRATRGIFEDVGHTKAEGRILFEDNDEDRRELEHCIPKQKYICNPIVDWSEENVWRFIKEQKLPYCSLYDEGFHRLGCIGCPMASKKEKLRSFERWPKYRDQYIRTFDKMIAARKEAGLPTEWKTVEEVMQWWIDG